MITKARISELLEYDQITGVFTWKKSVGFRKAGYELIKSSDNYVKIMIDGKRYKAHRLAWLLTYGDHPNGMIDHINGKKSDNRIANLRIASPAENVINRNRTKSNTSGFKGVSWSKKDKKWIAYGQQNYKTKYLGAFDNPSDAYVKYLSFIETVHSEFLSTGKCF